MGVFIGCATTAQPTSVDDWTVAPPPVTTTRSAGLPSYYSAAAPATVELPFSQAAPNRRAAGLLVHEAGWVVASVNSLDGVKPNTDMHLEIELRVGHLDGSAMRRGALRRAKVHKLANASGLVLLKLSPSDDVLPEAVVLAAQGPSIGQSVNCIAHGEQLWETQPGDVVSVSESMDNGSLMVQVDCGLSEMDPLGTVLVNASGELLALQTLRRANTDGRVQMTHVDEVRTFLQDAPDEPLLVFPESLGPAAR